MKPIIKWPGGKSREIKFFEKYIPNFDRYIEPFFGGGAVYFYLQPTNAIINDISQILIDYYKLIQERNEKLYEYLTLYSNNFLELLNYTNENYYRLLNIYINIKIYDVNKFIKNIEIFVDDVIINLNNYDLYKIVLDIKCFKNILVSAIVDKVKRTIKNESKKLLIECDLKNNLLTALTSGFYLYFRKVYNDINLGRAIVNKEYRVANFYFVREYCYGSMFRYNKNGEFNIPYGGISYNKKLLKNKIEFMYSKDVVNILKTAQISCEDFEIFIESINLNKQDFIFLDPPYDTEFSDYDNRSFDKNDQIRLYNILKCVPSKFMLVIKNTDFIKNLYFKNFNVISFDNQYSYNVRGRNNRDVEHFIITNYDVK